MTASIPRRVEVGDLSETDRALITRTVFHPAEPKPAEVLFIFGSVQGDWDVWAERISAGWFGRVVIAGQTGPSYSAHGIPISEAMRAELVARGVPEGLLHLQTRSTNTLEDVSMSLEHIGNPKTLAFAAKSHHSGRCARTLRRFFPNVELLAHCFDALVEGQPLSVHSWPSFQAGRETVMGEYLRIRHYSARGDIALFA